MSGFLCSMVGASFTVAAVAEVLRSKKGITALGDAKVSTAQSKFGGSSLLLDGNTDALYVTDYSAFTFTGDFTIEMFIRMTQYGEQTFLDMREGSGGVNTGALLYRDGSSNLKFELGGSAILTDADPNIVTNQWDHVAVSRSGTSIKLFVNGTQTASATSSASGTPKNFYIGRNSFSATSGNTVGYIDEVRISNSARYTTTFTPSTTPFVNDANTLLLIHANGTNASTYFEDDNGVRASRSLIAQGNAQIDTAQSKFGGSALLCDGTGDYVMSPQGTQWDFGTSSFTIEYWIRFNVAPTLYVPIALRTSASILNGEWWCEITNAEKKMYWGFKNQAGTQFYVNLALAGTAFATGQWYHIALVNNAGTAQMYVNGTATGTSTALSGSFGNTGTDLWVGAGAGGFSLNGWLDEVRISNTARYTAGFTAPTAPFVNDANTLLLIHADGTDASTVFRDDNGALANRQPNYITALGNAQVSTAQSKFGGASALFDGTGDYLSLGANSVTNDLALTSTTWTVEYWARITSHMGAFQATVAIWNDQTGVGNVYYFSTNMYNTTNKMGFEYVYGTNSGSGNLTFGSSTLATGVWQHHAFVRNGNTLTAYLDGVSQGTHDMTGRTIDITGFNNSGANSVPVTIGGMSTGSGSFNGYLDEVRISNIARYTAAFTPSTIPFTNDANTVLLIHANGTNASTAFNDDTGNRTQVGVTTDGTGAAVSTTQSKFGGSSLRLSYSGSTWDYLQITQPSSLLNFGTGDWTVEGWFRFDDTNTDLAIWTGGTTTGDLDIRRTNDNLLRIGRVNTAWDVISGSTGISANTWYHIAFVKGGGTARIYVDGTQVGTASNSISYSIATQLRIGAQSTSSLGMSGYIDELRASNIARYTAAFTPSTTPFQNDANTLLLLHCDGTDASTVFFDDNGIAPYTP